MKKFIYLFTFLFMGANFTSCTPTSINETEQTPQACCGEDGELDPPPPPPPTGGGGVTGG